MNIWLVSIFVFGFLVTCSVFLGLEQAAREEEHERRKKRVREARAS